MPEMTSYVILISGLIVFFFLVAYIALFFWVKSRKVDLQPGENLVKEGYITYLGGNVLSLFVRGWHASGRIFLTDRRLVLKYIRFMGGTVDIPLTNIRSVEKTSLGLVPFLKVSYTRDGDDKTVYFFPKNGYISFFGNNDEWKSDIERMMTGQGYAQPDYGSEFVQYQE